MKLSILSISATVFVTLVTGYAAHLYDGADVRYSPSAPTEVTAQEAQKWLHENWNGNAQSYRKVEAQIDQEISAGRSAQALLQQNKTLALKNPKDPMAQFRWGYSARKMLTTTSGYGDRLLYLSGVFQALTEAPSPNVYDYARLCFLTAPDSANLVDLGERLLKKDSHDDDVKTRLIGDYIQMIGGIYTRKRAHDVKASVRAVSLAKQEIASDPTNAKRYASLGSVYATCWIVSRSHEDASKAISAYKQYLRIAAPSDEYRPQILAMMKDLAKT